VKRQNGNLVLIEESDAKKHVQVHANNCCNLRKKLADPVTNNTIITNQLCSTNFYFTMLALKLQFTAGRVPPLKKMKHKETIETKKHKANKN
jgi:hypothetical protein